MAEVGLQAPDLPTPPPLPAPQQPAQPVQQAVQQAQLVVHLNWSHFKPEFWGKPEEDAEAHLLKTNDWMKTHHFWEGVKCKDFV